MSQYSSLFNTTRIPETGKDRLFRADDAKHVLVMRGGHFYVFDVFNKDGLNNKVLIPKHITLYTQLLLQGVCWLPEISILASSISNKIELQPANIHWAT